MSKVTLNKPVTVDKSEDKPRSQQRLVRQAQSRIVDVWLFDSNEARKILDAFKIGRNLGHAESKHANGYSGSQEPEAKSGRKTRRVPCLPNAPHEPPPTKTL